MTITTPTIFTNSIQETVVVYDQVISSSTYASIVSGQTPLVSVQVGTSCTTIANGCFYGMALQTITFDGQSVTTFGGTAFGACSQLQSIIIPNSVTSIGEYCFFQCGSLASVILSASMSALPNYAFAFAAALANIVIPPNITSIGVYCFYSCRGMNYCIISSAVTTIGSSSFQICDGLEYLEIQDQSALTTVGTNVFAGIGNVPFRVNVYNVDNYAATSAGFKTLYSLLPSAAQALTSYFLSETVFVYSDNSISTVSDAQITNTSYASAPPLLTVWFGLTCTSMGPQAFRFTNIVSASWAINSTFSALTTYEFGDCYQLMNVVLPNSLTTLYTAFDSCYQLNSIVIPDSIHILGNFTFSSCSSLSKVVLPPDLTSLNIRAFSDCTSLVTIVLPQTLTTLDRGVFYGCTSLSSIELPASVTTILSECFANCTGLLTLIIDNQNYLTTVAPVDGDSNMGIFYNISHPITVSVYNTQDYESTTAAYKTLASQFPTNSVVNYYSGGSCFDENVLICCCKAQVKWVENNNNNDIWVPVKLLQVGDLVKTSSHGYLPVAMIGKSQDVNSKRKNAWNRNLYECKKNASLRLTGGHGILVDSIPAKYQADNAIKFKYQLPGLIEGKQMLLTAAATDDFVALPVGHSFTFYNFVLGTSDGKDKGNDDARFGVFAGNEQYSLLVETPSRKQFLQHFA